MSSSDIEPHAAVDGFLDLLSSVSHDLRTPLSVIVGYAELLRMRDDAETRLEAAVRIDQAARRLSGLIDDLLLVAAIDRSDVPTDPEAIELEAAIGRAVAAASCTVALRAEEWPVVFADPSHLEHILRHLLAFAGEGSVKLVAAPRAATAVITLTSGGRPLDDTLFARFAPGGGGLGVGLYIARSLAELNGGSLVVEDGSFVLELPLDRTTGPV